MVLDGNIYMDMRRRWKKKMALVNAMNELIRGETGWICLKRDKYRRWKVGGCELCLVRIKCLIWGDHNYIS